jgi:hypothetical protein
MLILLGTACVDRITFDTGNAGVFPVVIDGYISDQPGPYTIKVTKAFDIESKLSIKTPISVKEMVLSDNQGNQEVLAAVGQGVYQTNPNGIRGTIGRVYKLHIELLDGRVYESTPDTLQASGKVDKVYYNFVTGVATNGAETYGFDVFFDSSSGVNENYHFLWQFVGTFKVITNPELHAVPCGQAMCPRPPACSGFIVGPDGLVQVGSCTCCSCWSNLFNAEPIVSSDEFIEGGRFKGIRATYVPLAAWTFMDKVHAEVRQLSLSRQAFDFWKAVRAQKNATGSLFQPLTGKVPGNFIQISGPESAMEGLFFATSIATNDAFITRADVPGQIPIPSPGVVYSDDCRTLFPYSTNVKPDYWYD